MTRMSKCNVLAPVGVTVALMLIISCAGRMVPVREYLVRGEPHQQGLGAYGYVVFTVMPNQDMQRRYRLICDAYKRQFQSAGEYSRARPNEYMATYWLLKSAPTEQNKNDCPWLVDNYDYATAAIIAAKVEKTGATGPLLVAWEKPYDSDQTGYGPLILDMSDFADDDIDRAFLIWKDRVVRDPAVWNKGFVMVTIREAFRNLIQAYGEHILSIFR